mmetsp:Transcript_24967/g.36571  ORF Transcript_24967/g.36571 Transcript_24967/m.36571 type:complete len:120 (-) Transcript_24967:505-864(-)
MVARGFRERRFSSDDNREARLFIFQPSHYSWKPSSATTLVCKKRERSADRWRTPHDSELPVICVSSTKCSRQKEAWLPLLFLFLVQSVAEIGFPKCEFRQHRQMEATAVTALRHSWRVL